MISRPSTVARILVTALLLAAFLASVLPLTTLASGPMCNLACCAGRAPHAAGSCMKGSCYAVLSTRSKTHKHHRIIQPTERLCGLSVTKSLIKRSTVIAAKEAAQRTDDRSEASLVATSLGKPCKSDCGTCSVSSFSSRNRERSVAALAHADKPRPLSAGRHEHSASNQAMALDALCRRSRPRGPPISSS